MGRGGDLPSYHLHRHSFVIIIRIFRRVSFVLGSLYKVGVCGSGVTGLPKFMKIGIGRLFCGFGWGDGLFMISSGRNPLRSVIRALAILIYSSNRWSGRLI